MLRIFLSLQNIYRDIIAIFLDFKEHSNKDLKAKIEYLHIFNLYVQTQIIHHLA